MFYSSVDFALSHLASSAGCFFLYPPPTHRYPSLHTTTPHRTLAGQAGRTIAERITPSYHTGGGGGGGSFVMLNDDLLLVGGGGGGGTAYRPIASSGSYTRNYYGFDGADGSLTARGSGFNTFVKQYL
jgi:hypothetical protein